MRRAPRQVSKAGDGVAAQQVVSLVRGQIERGTLKRGDQLPPERELAVQLGVSRPTIRAGLRSLATMGIVESRHGTGTFITDGPPALGSESLSLLATLHGFTHDEMFVARRVLEVCVASLAAEHADAGQLAEMAEEVVGMFAALDNARDFLVHEIRFHRALAGASGNPVLAALVDMVSRPMYERRRDSGERSADVKQAVHMYRRLYEAIRAHDSQAAGATMGELLLLAQRADADEQRPPVTTLRQPPRQPSATRRRRR
jgi:GntR family transcriptional repressor for pyruvate dehydrogenase complex